MKLYTDEDLRNATPPKPTPPTPPKKPTIKEKILLCWIILLLIIGAVGVGKPSYEPN